jgi:pimeloyl-ACP methyl ester carboxylesterase
MLWIVLAALFVLLIGHIAAAAILSSVLTRARRRRVEGTPADLGLRYEEIQFSSADGVALLGWWLESPGARATVVLVHDIDGTRSDRSLGLLTLQRDYLRRGLNVLAFDLRGRGESGGRHNTFGASERDDVSAAIAFARERTGELPVIVHGFGLGGTLAIDAAAVGLQVALVIPGAGGAFAEHRSRFAERAEHCLASSRCRSLHGIPSCARGVCPPMPRLHRGSAAFSTAGDRRRGLTATPALRARPPRRDHRCPGHSRGSLD